MVVHHTTVVPDTNVWRYIVDADAVETVRKAASANSVAIVACPAVVYECLRVSDRELRRRLAKALSRTSWLRLMPEAYLEAEALRDEIVRLRPEWILKRPDLREWSRNKSDWQAGFWRRVREQPDSMAEIISSLGGKRLSLAREEAKAARQNARNLGYTRASLRLDTARAWYRMDVPGWDGEPFEAWRANGEQRWWSELVLRQSETSLDWLEPWLDLERMRKERESWISFWTREVSTEHMVREWIRWAMAEVQALHKVTNGTPVDNQITTYLVDCDIFVTSDRGFAQCIDLIRPHSPASLAQVSVSPAGSGAVDHLLEMFSKSRSDPDSVSSG